MGYSIIVINKPKKHNILGLNNDYKEYITLSDIGNHKLLLDIWKCNSPDIFKNLLVNEDYYIIPLFIVGNHYIIGIFLLDTIKGKPIFNNLQSLNNSLYVKKNYNFLSKIKNYNNTTTDAMNSYKLSKILNNDGIINLMYGILEYDKKIKELEKELLTIIYYSEHDKNVNPENKIILFWKHIFMNIINYFPLIKINAI
jgi:hypothetical protein